MPVPIYQTRLYSVNYKRGKIYVQICKSLVEVNAWKRKPLCFSSSHGPPGRSMVFPTVPACPVYADAGGCWGSGSLQDGPTNAGALPLHRVFFSLVGLSHTCFPASVGFAVGRLAQRVKIHQHIGNSAMWGRSCTEAPFHPKKGW